MSNLALKPLLSSGTLRNPSSQATGTISFSRATQELSEEGVKGIMAFPGIENVDAIEDLASEFQNMSTDEIKTSVHVISIKLEGRENEEGFELSNLEKIGDLFKINKKPFIQFNKIQIFYIPLFTVNGESNGKIVFKLVDKSMKNIKDQVKAETVADIHRMSYTEFGMDYKVQTKDAKFIKVVVKPTEVPVIGRSYGTMFICFKTNKTMNPVRTVASERICVYMDNVEAPKDVNKKNVLTRIGSSLKTESEQRRIGYNKVERIENNRLESLKEGLMVKENEEEGKISSTFEIGEGSVNMISELDFPSGNSIWYLDTGASRHVQSVKFGINQKETKDSMILSNGKKVLGKVCDYPIYCNIGNNVISMNDIFITDEIKHNLLSLNSLKKNGMIDDMKIENNSIVLMKNKKAVFKCYNNNGMYVVRGVDE
nr:TPA_asm: movement protein [Silene ophiovirus]